jgi:hypothetical protein
MAMGLSPSGWQSAPKTASVAIKLINSKCVLIEDKAIEYTEQLLRKDDAITTGERGNWIK